jgi:hypothetical protein
MASIVEPGWVSQSASILLWKYYAIQTSVPDFWDHFFRLQPCDNWDAEEGGSEVVQSSTCQIKFPDGARMREFAKMVQLRALLVNDIIGFMDSISFPAECTNKCVDQNAY